MTRSINWLRSVIILLALTGFIIGMVLREDRRFPDVLTIMWATEVVTFFLYSEFIYISKVDIQFRGWRIFLRLILAILMIYGPVKALDDCGYYTFRDYDTIIPGFLYRARISCIEDSYDGEGPVERIRPVYRLFRARCIIMATTCVLIVVELCCYGWSKEGMNRPNVSAGSETRNDVELATQFADMVHLSSWLRILIPCLSLISFIIGVHLKDTLMFPDPLVLLLVTEALDSIFYAYFAFKPTSEMRGWRILNRLILFFLTIYGPARAMDSCYFRIERDYEEDRPGIYYRELLQCDGSNKEAQGNVTIHPIYRLFRARCIIMFMVSVLMFIEGVSYWWFKEGLASPDDALTDDTRNDVEMGGEPRKVVLPMHIASSRR
ncbi:hypothetical protein EC968_009992 [Mortierella alpina]|nr:hypothetical protein EC968_009992 [Mortierella alpina]